ncbi:RNA polymerase sigma factor [Flavobacterium caeni]|uniref:RNA polymerase sigma-70 factor, ECF subfamily n=1 Tax=Flavobacterium caeni TaxID=490189 RepID=A0A1G5E3E6_9FLAO|nr:RNA polymerase sigma factor [Flavobacterium caeni]SCY21385.1 RNA polymerase sigma-70 factor, ECF subfamily [Flavobacterium caeni]
MEPSEKKGICDEPVFTRFFQTHVKALRNFLYFRFGDADAADDIAQDAFVKLWQHCAEVQHPKAFVYKVARNASINHAASQKVALQYAQQKNESTADHVSPEFLIEQDEFQQKLERALNGLTPAQREALLLNRVEGKKYREIAEMLGISMKAVEKRIHGALVSLESQIENFR